MATSLVSVANVALTRIGDQRISALNEDSDRARAITEVIYTILDAKIREHSWNCFQVRTTLQEVEATPAYGFDHQFQLPQDPLCLDVLETNLDASQPWRIETYLTATASYRVLVTDATSVSILYLARILDPTLWDPMFADAFATELSADIAQPLTRNATLADLQDRKAQRQWAKAKSRDGQESRALNSLRSTALTTVRFGGGFGGERLP